MLVYVDTFDHDTDEPRGLRGEALDRHILSTATRVSIFWITETQARAARVDRWIDSGVLVLDHEGECFPWSVVLWFGERGGPGNLSAGAALYGE